MTGSPRCWCSVVGRCRGATSLLPDRAELGCPLDTGWLGIAPGCDGGATLHSCREGTQAIRATRAFVTALCLQPQP